MMASANPPGEKIQRQKLALNFAVLLTRSSYAETDQLDIVPVNQLERDMYQIRTTEYQPYVQRAGSVSQGDLTNPKHFDYMSCVQYLTINRAMKDPETDFEELQPKKSDPNSGAWNPELEKASVHRTVPTELLVPTHDERVGKTILDYMYDTYRGTPIALPSVPIQSRQSIEEIQQSLSQLVKLFLINGFAWEGKAQIANKGAKEGQTTFLLSLNAPATLWSGSCLEKQKAAVRNDFLLKTAKQFVQSMGYSVVSSSVKIKGNRTELPHHCVKNISKELESVDN